MYLFIYLHYAIYASLSKKMGFLVLICFLKPLFCEHEVEIALGVFQRKCDSFIHSCMLNNVLCTVRFCALCFNCIKVSVYLINR